MKLIGITAALFCALYALFWVVAVSTPHPTPESAPAPQIKQVWT